MSRQTMWWIEDKNGKLVQFGRQIVCVELYSDGISEGGMPNPQRTRAKIAMFCRAGERPVKVRLVKI